MDNCREWFYLCCGFLALIFVLFAMTLKYNLEMSAKYVKLKKEIQEVERVNGKEKQDIKELQQEVKELKQKYHDK